MTKQPTLQMRAEAAALRAVIALLRRMGPVAASNLGGAVARTVGPFLPVSRVAHANLRRALPELDDAARRRIVRGVWDNLGRTAAELPHLPELRQASSGPGWELSDPHSGLDAADGQAAIVVGGHLGNWEIGIPVAASRGLSTGLFYRSASNPLVDQMITGLRRDALGAELATFPKGKSGARGAMGHLSRGGTLIVLMDQKMNDGIACRFFGQTAMTASAMATLALRYRCPVIPANIERLGPARFRVVVAKPLPLPATGDRQADIAALTQAVNDQLEAWIRARPESWLWLHRRWPNMICRISRSPPGGRSA